MNPKLIAHGKKILSTVLPDSVKLRYFSYIPRLRTFLKAHSEQYPVFNDRYAMYGYVNDTVVKGRSIVYCEFGVFEGASLRHWTKINVEARSRFYGFDTFTGLPESWDKFVGNKRINTFDVGGEFPRIDDGRVSFIKGMFQDTLPGYLRNHDGSYQLIVHSDADLYSSTLYVLTCANGILVPGTILIFDEFSSMLHEFRALEDYCSSYLRKFDILAATKSPNSYYEQIVVRLK
jgi:O-methyltransferase